MPTLLIEFSQKGELQIGFSSLNYFSQILEPKKLHFCKYFEITKTRKI